MVGFGGMPLYTASKSAVLGLVRSLARDYGPYNVRVNLIAPGWIMTERQLTLWLTPEADAMRAERQCLKRRLSPRRSPASRCFSPPRRRAPSPPRATSSTAAGCEPGRNEGPQVQNPAEIRDIARPEPAISEALARIGTATISSELSRLGVRDPHIRGPVPLRPGRSAAGPALTLQCMPKREDLFDGSEYDNPDLQLHRHVMFPAQAGDMIVVDARGDMG